MIIRKRSDSYVLIRQHDHGMVSGEFARHWAEAPRPLEPTLYAIANHDVGWETLDGFVRWDERSGEPYSFTDYPIESKLRAYTEGLDSLEARNVYAVYLCSLHYASLAGDSKDEIEFRESEAGRRRRIEEALSGEELENLEPNFRLLQLCDNLSLFVCLNEPGRNDHPWFKDGFSFEGARLRPIWEDRGTLRLEPNPFSQRFDIVLPYRTMGSVGQPLGSSRLELRVTC